MAAIDLSKLSFDELNTLRSDIDKELVSRRTTQVDELKAKWAADAARLGMSVGDIIGSGKASRGEKKDKAPVAIKYRDPNEPNNTWTGRGRAPKWVVELEEKGGKREEWVV